MVNLNTYLYRGTSSRVIFVENEIESLSENQVYCNKFF